VLQNRMHLSQQKFFDLFCMHISSTFACHFCTLLLYHAFPLIIPFVQAACSTTKFKQKELLCIQHRGIRGWGLRDQAPLRLQGEPTAPGGAGICAGAATSARRPAPSESDDEEASDLTTPAADDNWAPSPGIANPGRADVAKQRPSVGHTGAKRHFSTFPTFTTFRV
jgi:hypothetical protein